MLKAAFTADCHVFILTRQTTRTTSLLTGSFTLNCHPALKSHCVGPEMDVRLTYCK